MGDFTKNLRQFFGVLLLITVPFILLFTYRSSVGSEGVSPVKISEIPRSPTHEISVLFIGNSYTFYNDMPQMLIELAESDPENYIQFTVQSVTRGGATLADLWRNKDVRKVLRERHWNYVVLQGQSLWAMKNDSVRSTLKAAENFSAEIQQLGGHPLLFETWARQGGNQWYGKSSQWGGLLISPGFMQKVITTKTKAVALRVGAVVIPVGEYWAAMLARHPDVPLYLNDGSHPTTAGSFLAALVFYRYFAGHNPDEANYAPYGVSAEQAKLIKTVVAW